MGPLELGLGLVIVGIAAFQVWLTMRVFRSNMFERKQKVLQAQLIWLIPIIGSVLVFSVLQEETANDRPPPPELKG
jgi:putative copper export protein